ncbi:MAG: YegS/Rv2252/BmrU family lipid kinase [Lachnospiraceae bacterium]|nr:YegS/Rv2252/BmrU family lipid kinase [Lachnospiraceae bacterium]
MRVKKRLVFIYNPNAGKAKIKNKLSDIVVEFAGYGYEVIVLPTGKRGDASEFARSYAASGEVERIVCSGGDGTLSEVVKGVLSSGRRVPVGFIPAGTTNDFSYSLKIPKQPLEAAALAASGESVPSDVGEIDGKSFIYTAAFGLFSDVSYDTPQNMKNILGRIAYLLRGVGSLHNVKSYRMRVEFCEGSGSGEQVVGTWMDAGTAKEEVAGETESSGVQTGEKPVDAEPANELSAGKAESIGARTDAALVDAEFVDELPVGETESSEAQTSEKLVDAEIVNELFTGETESSEAQTGEKPVDAEPVNELSACKAESIGARTDMEPMDKLFIGKTESIATRTDVEPMDELPAGGLRVTEGEFICGLISNSDSVGGFKGIMGKGVQFDDGIFEMVLIRRPHNLIELTNIINELLSRKLSSENIVYARVSEVHLSCEGELPWSLDGEYGGDMPQAHIHIRKQAADYVRSVAKEDSGQSR